MHFAILRLLVIISTISLLQITILNAHCHDITKESQCQGDCNWVLSANPTIDCIGSPNRNCECTIKSCSSTGINGLDIIILVDGSCPMSRNTCQQQQQHVASTMASISSTDASSIRIGYLEYGSSTEGEINNIVDLSHTQLNMTNRILSDLALYDFYHMITRSTICDNLLERRSDPNLHDAIDKAIDLFRQSEAGTGDKQVLIFSNCGVSMNERERICNEYEDDIRNGMNIVMVNYKPNTTTMIDPDSYIMCLVEYDPHKIFVINQDDDYRDFLSEIQSEICNPPTPAPTIDSTLETVMTDYATTISLSNVTIVTINPSEDLTIEPTQGPANHPTVDPTMQPTQSSTIDPTQNRSNYPSQYPSKLPTIHPFIATEITNTVTLAPNTVPSISIPTDFPSDHSTTSDLTIEPTQDPTVHPIKDSTNPTNNPSIYPTIEPTHHSTKHPTTVEPTIHPNTIPSISIQPTDFPSDHPTTEPTIYPTVSTNISHLINTTCDTQCINGTGNIDIEILYSFASSIHHNINNMQCILYKLFTAWFSFEFCVGDIRITQIIGGIENIGLCDVGPCFSVENDSVQTRTLLQIIDLYNGNGTYIFTANSDVIEFVRGIEKEISLEFDKFFKEFDIRLFHVFQYRITEEQRTLTTTQPNDDISTSEIGFVIPLVPQETKFIGLWILLGILGCGCVFVMVILCIRRYKYHYDVRAAYQVTRRHEEITDDEHSSSDHDVDEAQNISIV